MNEKLLDRKKHRWLGIIPIVILIWHGYYTVFYLHPHYLLFVCYTANLLVGLGILLRSGLMIGIGFGWSVIALPLWLYDEFLNGSCGLSGIFFHLSGVFIGGMAIKNYLLPKNTWYLAISLGLFLQLMSRIFTDESLNVNASFRVYEGWESLFPNYIVYFIVMLFGFSGFFILLTHVINKYFSKE